MFLNSKKETLLRVACSLFCCVWLICLASFVYFSVHVKLPKDQNEFALYFKENRNDLKYLVCKLLKSAKRSIDLSSFGFNDKDIVRIIERVGEILPIHIAYDPKETNLIPDSMLIQQIPYKKQGLMHRKFVCIDEELILLGSTNLTPLALEIHRNLIFCIRSKELYSALKENRLLEASTYSFFPMPQYGKESLEKLLSAIDSAKVRIFVCMFTFTHQKLAEALVAAKDRGVDVQLFTDRGMASGTSKKIIHYLKENDVVIKTHLGSGLLHHKCAWIDDIFVFGSANWTQAAFSKNEEHLLFLNTLSLKQIHEIKRFYTSLEKSSLLISNQSSI